MRRREFIFVLAGAAAGCPSIGRAQKPRTPIVGFLGSGSREADVEASRLFGLRQGLSETGHIEGRNVTIDYRWAEGHYDRLTALAADLARRQVTVIVSTGITATVEAVKAATGRIPIVFSTGTDPVQMGLVASLSRPGGNVTGVVTLAVEILPKLQEVLHELVPTATNLGLLLNPTSTLTKAPEFQMKLQAAAGRLGTQLHFVYASTEQEFEAVFASLSQLPAGGLVIATDVFFSNRSGQLAALTAHHAVPTISPYREFAAAGGLMSYGVNFKEVYRQVGAYAGRILKGESPAELPVQQVASLQLVINLKTAKALGLTVPAALLARADELLD